MIYLPEVLFGLELLLWQMGKYRRDFSWAEMGLE